MHHKKGSQLWRQINQTENINDKTCSCQYMKGLIREIHSEDYKLLIQADLFKQYHDRVKYFGK